MSNLLNVSTPNVTTKENHLYTAYTHVQPIVNKTSDGKYILKTESLNFTIKTDLIVPKGNNIKEYLKKIPVFQLLIFS